MLTNTNIPRPGDWDITSAPRGHSLNPWLKRINKRLFRRVIAADTQAEVYIHAVPDEIDVEAEKIKYRLDSLEIDEGNRQAWDEGNPDLRVIVHSDGSVTCEDDYVEWKHYEADYNEKGKAPYYQRRRVPAIRSWNWEEDS